MDNFIVFFEQMPTLHKLGWIIACLTLTWLLELAVPLVRDSYAKWRHAGRNLVFLSTSLIINVLFGLATLGIFRWVQSEEVGLLHLIDWNPWVELLIAVLALDFVAQWIAHYMLHKVPWMWNFHLVHHSDTMVDATTGTRHHPGDYFIREIFSLVAVILFGMPLAFYLFYRIATVFFTYFSHANITLPTWIDKPLSLVFITPNMHKFHHHWEMPWTDTNFGNIFSFWDRLFGTLTYDDPRKVRYGVDVLPDEKAEDVWYQMGVPFRRRDV